eukprot:TRINITY_DN3363_c0_g1_i3.p1 TRINITY_DN3363_c0_g1~~TRINITY_DN3363_c0_g1_i3.p1  ORF type:complete len:131 (+),score=32.46 TRINITY_DN3363_c0_g1_i3:101-493(+)
MDEETIYELICMNVKGLPEEVAKMATRVSKKVVENKKNDKESLIALTREDYVQMGLPAGYWANFQVAFGLQAEDLDRPKEERHKKLTEKLDYSLMKINESRARNQSSIGIKQWYQRRVRGINPTNNNMLF